MDISQLPFNQLIGLELVSPENGLLISLPAGVQYTNHLGTVHGSALLAVAEAGSGVFLMQQLGDSAGFVPVVRKLEAKFRKPASGRVSARCVVKPDEITRWDDELAARGRLSAVIPMEVVDEDGVVVMSAAVEWFIAKAGK
jgi:acyl-coenzyme A thioesterase PaaI-like protein